MTSKNLSCVEVFGYVNEHVKNTAALFEYLIDLPISLIEKKESCAS